MINLQQPQQEQQQNNLNLRNLKVRRDSETLVQPCNTLDY